MCIFGDSLCLMHNLQDHDVLYPTKEFVILFDHQVNPFKMTSYDLGTRKIKLKGDMKIAIMTFLAVLQATGFLLLWEIFMAVKVKTVLKSRRRISYFKFIIRILILICMALIMISNVTHPEPNQELFGMPFCNGYSRG